MGQVFFSGKGEVAVRSGLPTSICTNLTETRNGLDVVLKWNDPNDTIIDGQTLVTWSHTVIVRKKGGYPQHESDGDILFTNTVRNAYSIIGFNDTVPDSDDKYYYRKLILIRILEKSHISCFHAQLQKFYSLF